MAGKEKDSAEKSREFEGLILDLKKRVQKRRGVFRAAFFMRVPTYGFHGFWTANAPM